MFILKPHSGVPIYRQLSEQMRRMVGERAAPARHRAAVDTRSRDRARDQSDDDVEGLQLARGRGRARAQPRQADDGRKARARAVARPRSDCSSSSRSRAVVLAARQLELGEADVAKALRSKWEKTDEQFRTSSHTSSVKRSTASACSRTSRSTVEPGDIVGVLGKNGAGKTTLLELMLGFTPAERGRRRAVRPRQLSVAGRREGARRLRAAAGRAREPAHRRAIRSA